jgi:uncharacterized protein
MFTDNQKQVLLQLARQSIRSRFTKEPIIFPEAEAYQIQTGVFVSLHKLGELRGCIGYVQGYRKLVPSIIEMAQSAAFKDPRFPAVKETELKDLLIEISVLSRLTLVSDIQEIKIGQDGLLLNHPYGSGLLLPQVPVEWNWDLPTFLKQICNKAGLPANSWKDAKAELYRFSAEVFSECQENTD